ncbi:MAG: glycoside hydrolase [Gammaproteobacteria bacterium]
MSAEPRLKVVLCWHMHQPFYRDVVSGEYQLPWTYLHAIKDYVDMAAHLEAVPAARAVINFAPTLLEQIADYAEQVRGSLTESTPIRDPLLAQLDKPVLPNSVSARLSLMRHCLRANRQRLIERFPPYRQLADMADWLELHPEAMFYIGEQFLADILVWYHLAWLGETVRRDDVRVQELMDKGNGFSLHDRRVLLEIIGGLLSGLIDRYRLLAERGQVELSVSPYAHPIMPLLLDINSAKEAWPDVRLPLLAHYPDGEQRTRWHINEGLNTFRRFFGFTPQGCWPSEGSVSDATLKILAESGFRWTASGEAVLSNSVAQDPALAGLARDQYLYRPYRPEHGNLATFFRDDGLSDLIGFSYASWHADDAVANFIHNLENIARVCRGRPNSVVSIVLDGENAWEYYPDNGYYFLSALYQRLAAHPTIELSTFSDSIGATDQIAVLPHVVAGSWVYGSFSTWIGDPDKNRAWDMLGDAKCAFDRAVEGGHLSDKQLHMARRQMAICEGSDWFWWFGDYNPAATVSDFERLFRLQLANLYQLIGAVPPDYLAQVFAHGAGAPQLGGVMRPGKSE